MALPERFCRMLGLTAGPVTMAQVLSGGCCSPQKTTPDPTAADDDACCDLEVTYQKLEPVSGLKVQSFDFSLLSPALLSTAWEAPVFSRSQPPHEVLAYSDSSPPRSGRQLLQFIHLLLI
jgi:hypothetical protein